MLKKAKAGLGIGEGGRRASSLSQSVLKSSHQIWLAGLGAFAKAQTGGAKVFEALGQAGSGARSQDAAGGGGDRRRGARSGDVQGQGDARDGGWNVGQARARLPGARGARSWTARRAHSSDVERLTERVNELSEAVNALLKAQGVARPPRASPVKRMVSGAVNRQRVPRDRVVGDRNRGEDRVEGDAHRASKTVKTASKHRQGRAEVAPQRAPSEPTLSTAHRTVRQRRPAVGHN